MNKIIKSMRSKKADATGFAWGKIIAWLILIALLIWGIIYFGGLGKNSATAVDTFTKILKSP